MAPDRPAGRPQGIFVGLSTLDIIQRVREFPGRNAKATALRQDVAGGGPALNAAVVFSRLGGKATLVTRLGHGSISTVIREDLQSRGVNVADLAGAQYQPAVSTITIDDGTGDRQIVSTDALGQKGNLAHSLPPHDREIRAVLDSLGRADVIHLDGHHPDLTLAAARWGNDLGIPRVVDAGRWKQVMAELVPLSTDVICSSDFAVPDGHGGPLPWILDQGAELAAVTNGPFPVQWKTRLGEGSVDVEQFHAVDTLGAGDFFHGAYSFARAFHTIAGRGPDPAASLRFAGHIAALKCASPGTREWLDSLAGEWPPDHLRTE
ncbi:kinase [Arthrobacter livingstonensis]|uniref:Kinase n=1 Tax=Arthrobacter livingstonensis TaxID=670078 RepID=A0A2V5L6W2_9MICC|nr:PfkB family carbohydrate kinase [Arthrobacter livingstonensis]PYI66412.1 kinase [Arthrobacter livingstonensis]